MPTPQLITRLLVLSSLLLSNIVEANDIFPSTTKPGIAIGSINSNKLILENNVLKAGWEIVDGELKYSNLNNKLEINSLDLTLLPIFIIDDLTSSDFIVQGEPVVVDLKPSSELPRASMNMRGKQLAVNLFCENKGLKVLWQAELRDGSNYVRQRLEISTIRKESKIDYITSWSIPKNAQFSSIKSMANTLGAPFVIGNYFFGYEHPTSITVDGGVKGFKARKKKLKKGEVEVVVVKPPAPKGDVNTFIVYCEKNLMLDTKTRLVENFVMGIAVPKQLRRSFLNYIERERAAPYRQFLHYNAWYDIQYSSDPCDEAELTDVINKWGKYFIKPYGVKIDSFAIDDGWDDLGNTWAFDPKLFPVGFSRIKEICKKNNSAVGVWMSPVGGYVNGLAQRKETAAKKGFKVTFTDPTYYKIFRDRAFDMMINHDVNYFKFDRLGGAGNIAEMDRAREMMEEFRRNKPSVFLNITAGSWPSPFWLQVVDCTWRGGGDTPLLPRTDGNSSERWISGRDNHTYRNIVQQSPLYPLNSLMVHGVALGKLLYKERADKTFHKDGYQSFKNQVHSYFGAGYGLQELYISYQLMTPKHWEVLAESAKWARNNEKIFVDTHWIGGYPMRKTVYGWASWSLEKGLITLRNPTKEVNEFTFDIEKILELPEFAAKKYILKSPWKEDKDKEEIVVEAGVNKTITLTPFEVLNFEAIPIK